MAGGTFLGPLWDGNSLSLVPSSVPIYRSSSGLEASSMVRQSSAAALNQTSTVFTVVLAALILKEKVSSHQWVAVVLGFVGSLVVVLYS